MDKYDEGLCSRNMFTFLVIASQAVGILFVVLMASWMGTYCDGFSWDTEKVFNYHPLFMSVGMIFLYGDAILVYRIFGSMKRMAAKLLHASLLLLSLIFAIVGLVAVFRAHSLEGEKNLYSLHAWIGLLCIVLFCAQWVCGFALLLFNRCARVARRVYLPLHTFFGAAIFGLAVCAALMGTLENATYMVNFHAHKNSTMMYENLPPEALLANFAGLFIVIFAGIVFYLLVVAGRPRASGSNVEEDEMQLDETAGVNSGSAADYGGATQ